VYNCIYKAVNFLWLIVFIAPVISVEDTVLTTVITHKVMGKLGINGISGLWTRKEFIKIWNAMFRFKIGFKVRVNKITQGNLL